MMMRINVLRGLNYRVNVVKMKLMQNIYQTPLTKLSIIIKTYLMVEAMPLEKRKE
jgi:hypothetical protein